LRYRRIAESSFFVRPDFSPVLSNTGGAISHLLGEFTMQPAPSTVLSWAELLLGHIVQSETDYVYHNTVVSWNENDDGWKSYADCSSFVNALLKKTYSWIDDQYLQSWFNATLPLAKNYYLAIKNGAQFLPIVNLEEVQAGDLIAISYQVDPDPPNDDTGHVMLVRDKPLLSQASNSSSAASQSWLVPIIDQATSGHGPADSRLLPSTGDKALRFYRGLGSGVLRLFTGTDGQNTITGYAWSDLANSHQYSVTERPVVIGRLQLVEMA
jgi:hypothetical protein